MVVRAKICPLSGAKVPNKQKAVVGKVMAALVAAHNSYPKIIQSFCTQKTNIYTVYTKIQCTEIILHDGWYS